MRRILAIPLALAALAVSTDAHAVGPYTYYYYSCTDLKNGTYTQITDRTQSVKWPSTSYTLRLRSADFPTTGATAFRRTALSNSATVRTLQFTPYNSSTPLG